MLKIPDAAGSPLSADLKPGLGSAGRGGYRPRQINEGSHFPILEM